MTISKAIDSEDCENLSKLTSYFDSEYKEKIEKESTCCDVEGVSCEEGGIVSLSLNGKHITDVNSFISKLGDLKHLTTLKIEELEASELPSEIGNLENLKELKITKSKITKIPKELANLKKLTTLDLSDNKLEGYIPYKLYKLENLSDLHLNGNKDLKGYVPPFPKMISCSYSGTGLCTLKGETCHASIQCYKDEIKEGNRHNGSSDEYAYTDRAITSESERNVSVGDPGIGDGVSSKPKTVMDVVRSFFNYIITLLIIIILIIACWKYRATVIPLVISLFECAICCALYAAEEATYY